MLPKILAYAKFRRLAIFLPELEQGHYWLVTIDHNDLQGQLYRPEECMKPWE